MTMNGLCLSILVVVMAHHVVEGASFRVARFLVREHGHLHGGHVGLLTVAAILLIRVVVAAALVVSILLHVVVK